MKYKKINPFNAMKEKWTDLLFYSFPRKFVYQKTCVHVYYIQKTNSATQKSSYYKYYTNRTVKCYAGNNQYKLVNVILIILGYLRDSEHWNTKVFSAGKPEETQPSAI